MIEVRKLKAFGHGIDREFKRADLEFYGIDHFRPSFTTRVFFNDSAVDDKQHEEELDSFAGSFSIFGHGSCAGDEGHCAVHDAVSRFDDRPSHPLTRAFKRVRVTEALRRAIRDRKTLQVTLVASCDEGAICEAEHLLSFRGMQLVTFE